jgi:hypothetical protein
VIGFVKGEMKLQQFQVPVDGVDEPKLASHHMHSADAAVGEAARAAGNLIMDVARRIHRNFTTR